MQNLTFHQSIPFVVIYEPSEIAKDIRIDRLLRIS
jgi:hypothetical protein